MYTKVIQSGHLIEVYEYEREPSPARLFKTSDRRKTRSFDSFRPRRADSVNRARQSFRRLVQANLYKGAPALLTLTMLDILDYGNAMQCYTAFGQRFRRAYGKDISWIAVAEFQARGAVHFHALVWGLSYDEIHQERATRRIASIWGHGYVDIIPTDGSPKLATYLAKYLSKGMSDERTLGKRAYCASRNVLRPVSLSSPSAIDIFLEEAGISTGEVPCIREHVHGTQWLGRAVYKAYSLIGHASKN